MKKKEKGSILFTKMSAEFKKNCCPSILPLLCATLRKSTPTFRTTHITVCPAMGNPLVARATASEAKGVRLNT